MDQQPLLIWNAQARTQDPSGTVPRAVGYGKVGSWEAGEEHGAADAVVWPGQLGGGEGKLGRSAPLQQARPVARAQTLNGARGKTQ